MIKKLAILMFAAGAYAVGFWPSSWVRHAVLEAFGNPAYKGVWILIPHVFLYTTLSALTCLVLWPALIRLKWLEPMPFAVSRPVVIWGLICGGVSAVVAFGVFAGLQPGAVHAAHLNPWVASANLFSNFYEEFVFRGFLLAALTAVFGFWPAAILSSVAFGATHAQYPLVFRAIISVFGLTWCWIVRRTDSIWSAWIAHMVLDWIVDPFMG
ncbi:MAG TPA: CPBP family intramembrane glutamic endopeptidase [Dongiaceae bacterium]|nr:CPBP family intramembrane glutamic endopeptidase [Dongiaceae bacterium]